MNPETLKRVRTSELRRALGAVDRSGVCEPIEDLLGKGRPRQLPVRTLLLGLLLIADDLGWLTTAHEKLLSLNPTWRRELGITGRNPDGSDHSITYRQFEYLFNRLVRLLDSTPVARRRQDETRSEAARRARAAMPDTTEAAVRDGRLVEFIQSVLDGSIPDALRSHGHLAVDATDVETWATPPRRKNPSADLNAAWGQRSPREPGVKRGRFFGFIEEAAVLVPSENGPPIPELVRALELEPANAKDDNTEARMSLRMLERLTMRGIEPGDVLADSKYPSSVATRWTSRVWELGFEPVFDLHSQDKGQKGTEQGALIWNGALVCPAVPRDLLAKKPHVGADEVAKYRFSTKGKRDADGCQRYVCPARMGRTRCPLVEASLSKPHDRPTIQVVPSPAPYCCTTGSMTIPPTVANKTRQKHVYGSTRHVQSYKRRTAVERGFSRVKGSIGIDRTRGQVRVIGRAKTAVIRAVTYAAVNLRLVQLFEDRHREPAQEVPRARKRRRRSTYQEMHPRPLAVTDPTDHPPPPT